MDTHKLLSNLNHQPVQKRLFNHITQTKMVE